MTIPEATPAPDKFSIPGLSAQLHLPEPDFPVVALAASAGGLKALSQVLAPLPADFPAAVVVVQHLSPHYRSLLAEILSKRTALSVKQAQEADQLRPGTVYFAPPNKHLIVNANGSLSLSDAAKVRFVRPAADRLFESLATSCRSRAIAVVLTGGDSDGATGVEAIKAMGGRVIAQDEATSHTFSMPRAAIRTGVVDWVLPLEAIATTLVNLTSRQNLDEHIG